MSRSGVGRGFALVGSASSSPSGVNDDDATDSITRHRDDQFFFDDDDDEIAIHQEADDAIEMSGIGRGTVDLEEQSTGSGTVQPSRQLPSSSSSGGEDDIDVDDTSPRYIDPNNRRCAFMHRYCSRILISLLLIVAVAIAVLLRPSSTPSSTSPSRNPSRNTLSLISSPLDTRSYRYLTLPSNSLRVLLIHDSDTAMCSAAMSVPVGSGSDYPGREGLAHFLEHLLFQGSAAYPNEGEYSAFLSERGGSSNAYTSEEETNYFFSLQSTAGNLAQALPRFAGFFVAPLLSPKTASREMRAVEAEHAKNLGDDNWRAYALLHTLSAANSSFNHFGTGIVSTLNHSSIVSELAEFWSTYYKAQNMALVILGKESLDELEQLANEHFGAVPGLEMDDDVAECKAKQDQGTAQDGEELGGQSHRSQLLARLYRNDNGRSEQTGMKAQSHTCTPASIVAAAADLALSADPFGSKEFNRVLPFDARNTGRNVSWIPATTPSHRLALYFPTPSARYPLSALASNALGYISYMIGHEGGASTLASSLKSDGLIQSLSSGMTIDPGQVDQSLFAIEMELTTLGNGYLARRRIVGRVFEYVAMLREMRMLSNPNNVDDDSHEKFYATQQAEDDVKWMYADKESPMAYTQTLASRMTSLLPFHLPVRELLLPPSKREFNRGLDVTLALERLTVANMIILSSSSDFALDLATTWKTEKWYEIAYLDQPLELDLLQNIRREQAGGGAAAGAGEPRAMHFQPIVNEFVPTSFDVIDWASLRKAADTNADARRTLVAAWGAYDPTLDVPILLPNSVAALTNRLYYKPDILFHMPTSSFSAIILTSPDLLRLPTNLLAQTQFQLYLAVVSDAMTALRYQLSMVGFSVTIAAHPARIGIVLTVTGFSSMMLAVWNRVLSYVVMDDDAMKLITNDRYLSIRDDVFQSVYLAFDSSLQPYQHALYYMRLFEESGRSSVVELRAAYEAMVALELPVDQFRSEFVHAELLAATGSIAYGYGNMNLTLAYAMVAAIDTAFDGVNGILGRTALLDGEMHTIDTAMERSIFRFDESAAPAVATDTPSSPFSSYIFRATSLNPLETNSVCLFNLQIVSHTSDLASRRTGLLLSLLAQLISGPAFQQLRTVESLGYIVWATPRDTSGGYGAAGVATVRNFDFIVQSDHVSPADLEYSIERFISSYHAGPLASLSDADLATARATLRTSIEAKRRSDQNQRSNFDAIWAGKISRGIDDVLFERERIEEGMIDTITKQELIAFYESKFLNPATRRKFVIAIVGAASVNDASSSDKDVAVVTKTNLDVDVGSVTTVAERNRLATNWAFVGPN